MNEILPLELFQAAFVHLQIYFSYYFLRNKEQKQPVSLSKIWSNNLSTCQKFGQKKFGQKNFWYKKFRKKN